MKHGLADRLLEDLAAGGPVRRSVAETNDGLRDHIGARAELTAVSDEWKDAPPPVAGPAPGEVRLVA